MFHMLFHKLSLKFSEILCFSTWEHELDRFCETLVIYLAKVDGKCMRNFTAVVVAFVITQGEPLTAFC